MNRLHLWILACIPSVTFSQSAPPAFKKLSIGVTFEIDYVNQFLRFPQPHKDIPDAADHRQARVGGAIGVTAEYALTPRMALGTGLQVLERGYATKKTELNWVSPHDRYPTHSKVVFTSYLVEVPLNLKYNFNVAAVEAYITGGPSIGRWIHRKTSVLTYFKETKQKTVSNKIGDDYLNTIVSVHLGVGVRVPVSSRFTLGLEPLYRRTLTSLSDHREAERYVYSFGINTHLSLKFKK